MKNITYLEFTKNIKKSLAPIYLIAGEETYLLDSCLNDIRKAVNVDSLNEEQYQAPDLNGKDVACAVETLPFLTDKRLIVVKMANKLKNADYEQIARVIENPVDTSCLVLMFPEKLKATGLKRKDLVSLCTKSDACVCVECKKIYEKQAKEFIVSEFKSRNKIVDYEVINEIFNDSGTDLLNLSNEIEKICLYLGKDNSKVTINDFIKISGFTKDINAFMLANLIESKDLKQALFILEKLLSNGESPIVLLGTIANTVRKLLTSKSLIEEKNYTPLQAAEAAGVLPYFNFRKDYIAGLSKYTFKHLKNCLDKILITDIALKTSQTEETLALEKLLIFVCK